MADKKILRIATTNRHPEMFTNRIVAGYFLDSLSACDNPWQKGYDVVLSWFAAGHFDGYEAVDLYITSKPLINAGIIAALDDIRMPVRLLEHNGRGDYKEIPRDRWAQHLRLSEKGW